MQHSLPIAANPNLPYAFNTCPLLAHPWPIPARHPLAVPRLASLELACMDLPPTQLLAVAAHTQLTDLRLEACGVGRLPPAFSGLTQLRHLNLRCNSQLAGLEHIVALPLVCLVADRCRIGVLPPAFTRLGATLEVLDLSASYLPPDAASLELLGSLQACTSLAVDVRHACELPAAWSALRGLRELTLDGTGDSGNPRRVSRGLEHLTGLTSLSVLRGVGWSFGPPVPQQLSQRCRLAAY